MPDPQELALDFDRVARETGISMEAARNEVINETARLIVRNTPVRTGRLRASWFFSPTFPAIARAPGAGEIRSTAGGAAAASVIARLSGGAVAAIDGSLYFLNGANYAKYVEARTQFVRRVAGRAKQIEGLAIRKIRSIQRRGL